MRIEDVVAHDTTAQRTQYMHIHVNKSIKQQSMKGRITFFVRMFDCKTNYILCNLIT